MSVYKENAMIYISVEDTGTGMDEEQVKRVKARLERADVDELKEAGSLGMLNVSIRIRKYYGDEAKISVESEKWSGTCVTIRIPAKEEVEECGEDGIGKRG